MGDSVSDDQTASVTEAPVDNPLAGTRWRVTQLYDADQGEMVTVVQGSDVTMAFGANGKVNGSAGCNTYSASYTVSGSQLAITPPAGTGMVCDSPEGVMQQETVFKTLLTTVGGYAIEGNSLYLQAPDNTVIMELIAY